MDNKLNYTEENEEREDGKLSYRTPIYLQLREIIRNRIEEGEYLPGTAIPSENKLAETYGINRLTVRNAVDTLVNEGILRRVQGKGVFVVGDKYEENLDEHGGFVNVMSSGTKRVSIKEQAKIYRPAGNKYANYFNIEPDDLIFCVRHQITLDSEPLAIEDIYVPKDVLPKLEVVNSSVFTIKDIFAFYGIEISSMQQTMEIIDGTSKIKKLLLCWVVITGTIMVERLRIAALLSEVTGLHLQFSFMNKIIDLKSTAEELLKTHTAVLFV